MFKEGAFSDKRVLVTGATRGLGLAIARGFAELGARVALNYASDEKAAARARSELERLAPETLLLKGDVSSRVHVEEMVGTVLDQWGHIDVLVNNAGVVRDRLLMFLDEEDWDLVLGINAKGTYLCSRAVLRSMVGRRFGRIINMTSPSALTGRAGQTNYAASKGAVISFTKSLSRETARLGITVNAVCPGVIDTSMTAGLDEKVRSEFLEAIPAGKFGDPGDVARAVLFLALEDSGYITGQVLAVDGGLT